MWIPIISVITFLVVVALIILLVVEMKKKKKPTPDSTVSGSFYLDCDAIHGSVHLPSLKYNIIFEIDAQKIATVAPTDVDVTFAIPIPDTLKDNTPHLVRVHVDGTDAGASPVDLTSMARAFSCPPTGFQQRPFYAPHYMNSFPPPPGPFHPFPIPIGRSPPPSQYPGPSPGSDPIRHDQKPTSDPIRHDQKPTSNPIRRLTGPGSLRRQYAAAS